MGRGSVPSDAVFYIVSVAPVAMRLPVLGVEIIGGISMVHSTLFSSIAFSTKRLDWQ
jgi:hypothetical protein